MSLNKFQGIGNLGRDPEMRQLNDGKAVTNFSVALTERYKDKSGESKEVTEWVNVVTFGRLAEIAAQYLAKGSMVYFEGKLKTDKYDKNGETRYTTKVIAERFEMLGGKKDRPAKKDDSGFDDMDNDIPF